MENQRLDDLIKRISEHTAGAFSAPMGEIKHLSADTLYSNALWRQSIEDVINECYSESLFIKSQYSDEMGKLKATLDTLLSQKERLIKQLNESDLNARKTEKFFRNALVGFIELFRDREDSSRRDSMKRFSALLRNKAGVKQLDEAFKQLKNEMIKEPPGHAVKSVVNPFSLFKNRIKSPPEGEDRKLEAQWVERLRNSFQDIIDETRLTFAEDDLKKIRSIEEQLSRMTSVEDYVAVRGYFISLLHQHVFKFYNERQQAAAFIREIGERFVEMESHLIESVAFAQSSYTTEGRFNAALQHQIDELKNKVDFSKTLTELKQSMFARLSAIKEIIEKKHVEDMNRKSQADKQISILRHNIDQMKTKISECRKHATQLEKEVLLDPLTGIYNRRAYDCHLKEEFQRYLRYNQIFSLLLFDVDYFKQVNDTYGHAVGDKCLVEIVKRVKKVIRESDFMARFGGEEFVIILPATNENAAREVAEKVRNEVDQTEFIHKADIVKITISVGVTTVRVEDTDPDGLFQRLDLAMYEAKKSGRNKVIST